MSEENETSRERYDRKTRMPLGHEGENIPDRTHVVSMDLRRALRLRYAEGVAVVTAARSRLEELRTELRAERISYGELAELEGLAGYIESGDVELLEAAGVPEFFELECPECGEAVWDGPRGHKLAKCWNVEGHANGGTLAFDTMGDDDE